MTALETRVLHRTLTAIRIGNPFLLRSVSPPISDAEGKKVLELRRLGKRIVFGLEHDLFLVLHLMIAGRLRWKPPGTKLPRRSGLAAFDFADGTLVLTEAGSKRRASLYLVEGESGLGGARSRWARSARGRPRPVPVSVAVAATHAEAFADRPEALLRYRQRLLGRNPPSGQALALQALHRSE